MIKYSIIIPVYNVEAYLEECINSLLRQTNYDYEIILIDDGSSDQSASICNKYCNYKVKVIHQENSGVSNSRNVGINKAKGKYILFIDPDDYVLDDYLDIIDKNIGEYDMLIFSYNKLYMNKIIEGFKCNDVISSTNAMRCLIDDNKFCGYVWNKVYKRDIIDKYQLKFDPSVSMCEDVLFNFQYLLHSNNIKAIDDVLINYRQRKSSAISKKVKDIEPASLVKTYDYIIKNTNDEFVKIKSEALYLKNFYKYYRYIKTENFNMKLVEKIKKSDYHKISETDKRIILMYRYIPIARTLIYKIKDILYHKFD